MSNTLPLSATVGVVLPANLGCVKCSIGTPHIAQGVSPLVIARSSALALSASSLVGSDGQKSPDFRAWAICSPHFPIHKQFRN